jgi:hypothetical protein
VAIGGVELGDADPRLSVARSRVPWNHPAVATPPLESIATSPPPVRAVARPWLSMSRGNACATSTQRRCEGGLPPEITRVDA